MATIRIVPLADSLTTQATLEPVEIGERTYKVEMGLLVDTSRGGQRIQDDALGDWKIPSLATYEGIAKALGSSPGAESETVKRWLYNDFRNHDFVLLGSRVVEAHGGIVGVVHDDCGLIHSSCGSFTSIFGGIYEGGSEERMKLFGAILFGEERYEDGSALERVLGSEIMVGAGERNGAMYARPAHTGGITLCHGLRAGHVRPVKLEVIR